MRKTLTLTAALAAVLLAGATAHASTARTARDMIATAREAAAAPPPPPQTPAALVHDLRAVLHHAGFQPKRAEHGIPGRAPFIHEIERIVYKRQGLCHDPFKGFDAIGDYLSLSLAGWGAVHHSGSSLWIWRERSADESVTLWYTPSRCSARAWREASVSLVIAHYTPPAGR